MMSWYALLSLSCGVLMMYKTCSLLCRLLCYDALLGMSAVKREHKRRI